jgi:hypothetical protein
MYPGRYPTRGRGNSVAGLTVGRGNSVEDRGNSVEARGNSVEARGTFTVGRGQSGVNRGSFLPTRGRKLNAHGQSVPVRNFQAEEAARVAAEEEEAARVAAEEAARVAAEEEEAARVAAEEEEAARIAAEEEFKARTANAKPFIPEAVRLHQLRKKYKKEDRKNANFIQRQTAEALALKNSLKNSNVNPRYPLNEEEQAYVDSENEKANSIEDEARRRYAEEELEHSFEKYMTGFDGGKRKKKKYTQRRQKKQRRRHRHRRSTKKYHRK